MRAAAVALTGVVVTAGVGCGLIDRLRQSPLLERNQLPPPPPVTFSRYHLDGWDWGQVARVVVLSPRNESDYTRAGGEFQDALASELQRLGRFEAVAAPLDDHAKLASFAHQGGRFDEGVALDIARTTRADVLVYLTVTQYSPYPRPRMGVTVQAVAPAAGKVAASVDGLWDTADGGVAELVRAYYRQRPKPLPAYVRNHTIVADDNFAADLALDSPALFQRFVANTVAHLLVDPDWTPPGVAKPAPPSAGGTGADCAPDCRPRPLLPLCRDG